MIANVLQVYSGDHGRAIVFCETKREADNLAASGIIKQESHVLHGDIPQEKRELVLKVWVIYTSSWLSSCGMSHFNSILIWFSWDESFPFSLGTINRAWVTYGQLNWVLHCEWKMTHRKFQENSRSNFITNYIFNKIVKASNLTIISHSLSYNLCSKFPPLALTQTVTITRHWIMTTLSYLLNNILS